MGILNWKTGLVSAAAAAFVGFCIYFDKKRRADSNYLSNVRDRREQQWERDIRKAIELDLPLTRDPTKLLTHYETNMRFGGWLLECCRYEEATEYLANAICVCAEDENILIAIKKVMPKQFYKDLVKKVEMRSKLLQKLLNDKFFTMTISEPLPISEDGNNCNDTEISNTEEIDTHEVDM